MSTLTRRAFLSCALGLALTLAGLLDLTILDRAIVQPKVEPYASYFVEARGWPVAWLVTEPSTDERPLHLSERFLVSRFLVCWIGATLLSAGLSTTFRRFTDKR